MSEQLPVRIESRFLCSPQLVSTVATRLHEVGFSGVPEHNARVQTLYYATTRLETPQEGYLRSRRYTQTSFEDVFDLDLTEPWFLEAKLLTGEKQRARYPLRKVMQFLDNPDAREELANNLPAAAQLINSMRDGMSVMVATQWHREHYVSAERGDRVTIDQNRSYYGFRGGQLRGEIMGQSPMVCVEVKQTGQDNVNIREIINGIRIEIIGEGWHAKEIRGMYKRFLQSATG